ncbi:MULTISPECIES: hypothetical protein [Bacillaceae]|uniref:hypothetical protein n=1 Tax=Bacillaceae TaxID=186817 RepID=UPI00104E6B57|nr:hypothetical protein [Bacillus sp. CBEL-1]TDB50369.1 hypothetical protein EPL02_15060 [Bacillus sp. CBEL-1]USY54057.1 hypothetical protein NIZ91_15040 [Bacillus sp. 1780r2a1]
MGSHWGLTNQCFHGSVASAFTNDMEIKFKITKALSCCSFKCLNNSFFQPDASQLTSFGLPAIVLLINRGVRKSVSLLLIVILFGLITTSWIFLDNLSSIAYVEEIVGLVAQMGIIWYISGILALILLPIPFVLFPPKHFVLPSICIGMYFTLLLISTLFGSFPVPLMGYGASPILGFLIAITWYGRTKFSSLVKGESIDKEPL